jgi:hypothetical protein
MLEIDGRPQRRFELAPVRLEHRRAAIGEKISIFGVDDHRDGSRLRPLDGRCDHGGDEHALVVILEHERVRCIHRAKGCLEQTLDVGARDVRVLFFIDANDLLAARDDARLRRRRPVQLDERAWIGANRRKHPTQTLARSVAPDRGHELRARP